MSDLSPEARENLRQYLVTALMHQYGVDSPEELAEKGAYAQVLYANITGYTVDGDPYDRAIDYTSVDTVMATMDDRLPSAIFQGITSNPRNAVLRAAEMPAPATYYPLPPIHVSPYDGTRLVPGNGYEPVTADWATYYDLWSQKTSLGQRLPEGDPGQYFNGFSYTAAVPMNKDTAFTQGNVAFVTRQVNGETIGIFVLLTDLHDPRATNNQLDLTPQGFAVLGGAGMDEHGQLNYPMPFMYKDMAIVGSVVQSLRPDDPRLDYVAETLLPVFGGSQEEIRAYLESAGVDTNAFYEATGARPPTPQEEAFAHYAAGTASIRVMYERVMQQNPGADMQTIAAGRTPLILMQMQGDPSIQVAYFNMLQTEFGVFQDPAQYLHGEDLEAYHNAYMHMAAKAGVDFDTLARNMIRDAIEAHTPQISSYYNNMLENVHFTNEADLQSFLQEAGSPLTRYVPASALSDGLLPGLRPGDADTLNANAAAVMSPSPELADLYGMDGTSLGFDASGDAIHYDNMQHAVNTAMLILQEGTTVTGQTTTVGGPDQTPNRPNNGGPEYLL
ncbi:hypothetical protein GC177_02580 [bacterium]|nr:hypothetical protein [bacterium]